MGGVLIGRGAALNQWHSMVGHPEPTVLVPESFLSRIHPLARHLLVRAARGSRSKQG